ncbi:MAG: lytic transglycosylase domain-containing protein [Bdellovibrionales bacterium]|nr:lytic transglycosylase domain-containing protein [Bdellovibrionales bacterium]
MAGVLTVVSKSRQDACRGHLEVPSFAKLLGMSKIKYVSILVSLVLSIPALAKTQRVPASQLQREARLDHAQELLGKYYSKSVVKSGEKVKKINSMIYRWAKEHLPKAQQHQSGRVAQAVIDESLRYNMDPVFLLSVIQGESSFDPMRLGALDEIGLMQLRPGTAEWIARREGLKYTGSQSLFDPVVNIKIGAAYLNYLRNKFDSHAQLYLAAYNMGPLNVGRAREKKIWPKDYPSHVMKFYVEFYTALEEAKGGGGKS